MADPARPDVLVPIRQYDAWEWRVGLAPGGQLRLERPPTSLHLREALRQGSRFDGDHAHRALAMPMPVANRSGATKSAVQSAVRAVLDAGSPERFLESQARTRGSAPLHSLGDIGRLALELANADARERRFMEGELLQLEWEWREAERIAAIADGLLLPAGVRSALDRLRGRTPAPAADLPEAQTDRRVMPIRPDPDSHT